LFKRTKRNTTDTANWIQKSYYSLSFLISPVCAQCVGW
jgi:hypothetical protein